MTINATAITHCKACGSSELYWFTSMRNIGSAQDGRLCMHEVTCDFVLGCNHCSETLDVVGAEYLAAQLTKTHGRNGSGQPGAQQQMADHHQTENSDMLTAESVYSKLSRQGKQRTSIENVQDVLVSITACKEPMIKD